MTDTLEPMHTIPLGPTLSGEVALAKLQFAVENGKPVLYAAVPVWNATWGRWFTWHAPEIMVGSWLVVVIVLAWRLLHVRRTPREAGRRYCRRCNYQLTKPQLAFDERGRVQWASAEAKCPECGYRSKRLPVRGRSAWVRRLPWIACSLIPLLVLPVFIWRSLDRYQSTAAYAIPTWPIQGLERALGTAALQRSTHAAAVQSAEFWRIDPADGRVTRRYSDTIVSRFTLPPFVVPGGKFLVALSEPLNGLVILDTATGVSRTVSHPAVSSTLPCFLRVLGFPDESRVFVQRQSSLKDSDVCELNVFHLPAGPYESVAKLSVPREGPTDSTAHEFDATMRGGQVVWALHSTSWTTAASRTSQIRMRVGGEIKMMYGMRFAFRSRFSIDGTAILIWTSSGREEAFDSITGELIATPDERILARASEHPTLISAFAGPGLAAIVDKERPGGKYLLPAGTPTGDLFPDFSPIDRFAVQIGDRAVASRWHEVLTGKPTRLEGEIRIFRVPDPPVK